MNALIVSDARYAAFQAAITGGFGLLLSDWTDEPDGTVAVTEPDGTRLVHTPGQVTPFAAVVPCPHHGTHRFPLTWPDQVDDARRFAAACTPKPRPAIPLWRITTLADRSGLDHQSENTP